MPKEDYFQSADKLMKENSVGDTFSTDVPPDWPVEAWEYLLGIKSDLWDEENLHFWISHHTYAPEKIVRLLAQSPYWRVRSRIAQKRNLPEDLFKIMSEDGDEAVRSSIAQNKKTPATIVQSLINDPAETVRRVVQYRLSKNPNPTKHRKNQI